MPMVQRVRNGNEQTTCHLQPPFHPIISRSRAESLGMECKVGIAQRAERILGLGLTTIVFGSNWRAIPITAVIVILAALSLITVVQRFVHVRRQALGPKFT